MVSTYTNTPDSDLVELSISGTTAAFEELYRRYFDRLFDFAARTTKNRETAADLVQDSFIKAHGRLDQLRDKAAFRPWMYSIVRREAMTHFRNSKREDIVSTLPAEDSAATNPMLLETNDDLLENPASAAELAHSASLVWEAAASLDADSYTVLDLHVRQGLNSAEIADVLQISKGSAYTRLNRTKERTAGAIATFLLIRKGSEDCSDLSALVSAAEIPPITSQLRKRVNRHVRTCEDCEERRRALVSPMQVFAALAAVSAPAGVRETVWANIESATSPRRSLRRSLAVAAMLIVIVIGGLATGITLAQRGGAQAALPPASTTSTTANTDGLDDELEPETEDQDSTTSTSVIVSPPDPPASDPSGDGGDDGDTVVTTTIPKPPVTAPDVLPPDIGSAAANPAEVYEADEDFLSCPAETDRVSSISADVTDGGSGVDAVLAEWTIPSGSGSTVLTRTNETFSGFVGPFPYLTVPDNSIGMVTITIRATDVAGNESKTTVGITVNSLAKCFG